MIRKYFLLNPFKLYCFAFDSLSKYFFSNWPFTASFYLYFRLFDINKNICTLGSFFFKKMAQPWPLFRLFSVFSNKHNNFYNNNIEKYPSIIRCRDSNPQPLERESLPITNRPGLPPKTSCYSSKFSTNKTA